MKYLVILIVSLLTITSSYSNEWEEVFKVTGVPKGIECPDTNNCYIVTDLNNLYGSSNKGKNWTFLTELTDKYNWVKDISVPDSSNIFVAHFESVIYQINNDISIVNDIRFNDTMRIQGLTMFSKDIGFMMPDGPQSYITYDGWKTYHLFRIENKGYLYSLIVFVPTMIRTIIKLFYYKILKDITREEHYKIRLNGLLSAIKGLKSIRRP